MALVEPDEFEGREVARVFLAASLAEAKRAEEVLTADGVDYLIELEKFSRGIPFLTGTGAAFYVLAGQAPYCRTRLTEAGLAKGVVEDT